MANNTDDLPPARFTVGDTVSLKSTGRPMLVDEVMPTSGRLRYRCMWVDVFGGIQLAEYTGEQLERVPEHPVRESDGSDAPNGT